MSKLEPKDLVNLTKPDRDLELTCQRVQEVLKISSNVYNKNYKKG